MGRVVRSSWPVGYLTHSVYVSTTSSGRNINKSVCIIQPIKREFLSIHLDEERLSVDELDDKGDDIVDDFEEECLVWNIGEVFLRSINSFSYFSLASRVIRCK